MSVPYFAIFTISRADTASGWTTKTRRTSIPRALRSPSVLSLSSTRRRLFALSSHTLPPLAVTLPRSSASSTPFRLAISTVSPPPSTGFLVTMLLSIPASRTRRPRLCSLNSVLSSHTSDSPLCQRSRLPQLFDLQEREGVTMIGVGYDNERNSATLAA